MNNLYAQITTEKEAIVCAEKLYQCEMLSEKGKNQLIEQIRSPKKSQSYTALILDFCDRAFNYESHYRAGIFLHNEFFQERENQTIEDDSALHKEFERRFAEFEGAQIEEKIGQEDTLRENMEYVFYPSRSTRYEDGLIHPHRSVRAKHLTRTANDLLNSGLINQLIHTELIAAIKASTFPGEEYVVMEALKKVRYYENYSSMKAKQVKFANQLKAAHVISKQNYKKLLDSYGEFELREHFDFLQWCNRAKTFELKDYPQEVTAFYEKIFSEISLLIPELKYQNFKIKIENQPDGSFIRQMATISFDADRQTYRHSFSYNYFNPQKLNQADSLPKITPEFHKAVNKWLADRNAADRLYYARHQKEGRGDSQNKFGLIVLTKTQREVWNNIFHFLSEENHNNDFNTEGIENIIGEYEKTGLFSHLTAEEIAQGRQKANSIEIVDYQSILCCFPDMIVAFDLETGNLDNPYEDLTEALGKISRGAFTPVNIKDTFGESLDGVPTCQFSFELKGKLYETTLEMNGDWLDPNFMELISRALRENEIDGDFYKCVFDGQGTGYIFLTDKQYEYLKQTQPELLTDPYFKEWEEDK